MTRGKGKKENDQWIPSYNLQVSFFLAYIALLHVAMFYPIKTILQYIV